ncbi:MAG TPA: methylated-DNA--[protein]-cysteine S-methyltransferase [Chitinophagaceae bacterium]|nr:methylated-DNA--[protein]-cysteine S-methyltransferase [Chitinophagaceae bacterium]
MEDRLTTYYHSPLGLIRVSGTRQYITEVHFMEEAEAAAAPQAVAMGPLLIQCVEELIQYFNGQRRHFEVPVLQNGSEFQRRVWTELSSISYGKTISYLDLARRLGDPKVIRAAAAANGKNNIAIIVPCHRVIGSNQQLVGYASGLWRKKWLLQHEAKQAHGIQTLF